MKIEQIKAQFVGAVKAYVAADASLDKAYGMAKAAILGTSKAKGKLKELRDTLLAWCKDAGVKDETARSVVSALMCADNLRLRAAGGGRKMDPEKKRLVKKVLQVMHETFGDLENGDLAAILLAAARELRA